jgi:hypothetical protein
MDPFTGIAGRIITSVGFSAIVATASATTSATKNIYDIILGINKNSSRSDIAIVNKINEMDIATSVSIIESNLNMIDSEKLKYEPVVKSKTSLEKIIIRIRDELKDIRRKLAYNNSLSKFTKQFRSYDLNGNLMKLTISNNILHNRFKLLLESLKISKNSLYNELDKEKESTKNLEKELEKEKELAENETELELAYTMQ